MFCCPHRENVGQAPKAGNTKLQQTLSSQVCSSLPLRKIRLPLIIKIDLLFYT